MPTVERPSANPKQEAHDLMEAANQGPFSWEALDERALRRRLARNLPPPPDLDTSRNAEAIEFLNTLRQGDPERQRAELEYLMRVLDEDRPSDRKLFP